MVSSSSNPDVQKRLKGLQQTIFEVGIISQSFKKLDYTVAKDTGSKELRDCVANQIIYPDHQLTRPDMAHYRYLTITALTLIAFAFMSFMGELVYHPYACGYNYYSSTSRR